MSPGRPAPRGARVALAKGGLSPLAPAAGASREAGLCPPPGGSAGPPVAVGLGLCSHPGTVRPQGRYLCCAPDASRHTKVHGVRKNPTPGKVVPPRCPAAATPRPCRHPHFEYDATANTDVKKYKINAGP